jgi:hypothetical protein
MLLLRESCVMWFGRQEQRLGFGEDARLRRASSAAAKRRLLARALRLCKRTGRTNPDRKLVKQQH